MIANRNDRMISLNTIFLYWKLPATNGCQKVIKSFKMKRKSFSLSTLSDK